MSRGNLVFVARFAVLVAASWAFFFAWYALSRRFDADEIVFYGALRTLGYSLVALVALLGLLRVVVPGSRAWLQLPLVFPVLVIYLLAGYAFAITTALLDRSISIYLIAAVAQAGERGLSKDELRESFLRDFVDGGAAVDKRLREQLVSKDIVERDGRYVITERGRAVYGVNRSLARMLNIPGTFTEPAARPAPK